MRENPDMSGPLAPVPSAGAPLRSDLPCEPPFRRPGYLRRRRWGPQAVLLAAFLFAMLIRRSGGWGAVVPVLTRAVQHPGSLAGGLALFALSLGCGLTRWYVLMRHLGMPVRFTQALRLYAAGHFFNVLGPGATGGDVVKAAWLARLTPGHRAEAVSSIAAERLIGLLGMVFFVSTIAFVRADFFRMNPVLTALRHGILLAFAVAAAVVLTLAFVDLDSRLAHRRGADPDRESKVLSVLLRIWRTLHVCMSHKVATAAAFLLSLLNHISDVCAYVLMSHALGLRIPFIDLLVVSPLANTIAAIPVTPGGAGVRETTLQSLLTVIDIPPEASASLGLLMFFGILFWALIGGLIMLFGASLTPMPRWHARE